MDISVVTPVETEPVTLAEAKLHLRLIPTDDSEDALVESLITAAREYCENRTGRALATQTIEGYLDRFPVSAGEIELPMPPAQAVERVSYIDVTGLETVLEQGTDYLFDDERQIGRIVLPAGRQWPQFNPAPVNPVRIRFIAGYDAQQPCPKSLRQAMLLLIGHWYANREAVGTVGEPIAYAVRALTAQYKEWWF